MNDTYDNDLDDLDDDNNNAEAPGAAPVDFARMGLNQIAYTRRTLVNDAPVWTIYSASGDTLGAAQTFEQAWGAILQNNLEPMWVN
ncbi:MAG: hypothetical protein JNM81_02060 [Rhodospirillaceae bacterium]|nr:hypothetical protein [Rhodospirillaceae bacterium]